MDQSTADSFVNRDEPVPVVKLDRPSQDTHVTGQDREEGHHDSKADRLRRQAAIVKDGLLHKGRTSEKNPSMQDRLLEKLLQQVIPTAHPHQPQDEASPNFIEKPNFNITTMSNNFRRFNARIGAVFVFQVKVNKLLSWRTPSHTLSFLSIYTFVCLDPSLIPVLPMFVLMLALLIPSFIARHPAAPSTTPSSETVPYSPLGPPIAPAPTIKPVKELSKDFFHNMRDLQNSMEDFSIVHDKILSFVLPPTNFSNEALSSTLFVLTVLTTTSLFLTSHLIPWKPIFLLLGWAVTCSGHPTIQRQMLCTISASSPSILHSRFQDLLSRWINHDVILDTPPESHEVEIFELQKISPDSEEWESWLFSPTPYDPWSGMRLNGAGRPQGTRFLEDVRPPDGWEWSEKKWALDLWSREWVEERIITGVEVETEGERWVYDAVFEGAGESTSGRGDVNGKGKGMKMKMKSPVVSWEEGVDGGERRGEWRRRRWVRMVKRKLQTGDGDVRL